MQPTTIPLHATAQFGKLILDFVQSKGNFSPFHEQTLSIEGVLKAAENRDFPLENRTVLVEVLREQYASLNVGEKLESNFKYLEKSHSYTITTGHQLNLFTGPIYFIYKILHVIQMTEMLNAKDGKKRFVPVFWLASEDHDFEEIKGTTIFGQKYEWTTNQIGAVGRFDSAEVQSQINHLEKLAQNAPFGKVMVEMLRKAYASANLSQATRTLVHALFGEYGLVILDGDNSRLKGLFAPLIERELKTTDFFDQVSQSSENLASMGYKVQVNPREINLFYLSDKGRNRIIATTNGYALVDSDESFSEEEMQELLKSHPERFSPNAIYRPVYQETVLPNLAYVGGAGEISYWLQLKSAFEAIHVSFPILVVRNSFMVINEGQQKKLQKLNVSVSELFKSHDQLQKDFVLARHQLSIAHYEKEILEVFDRLSVEVNSFDHSLAQSINAEKARFEKSWQNLDKKIVKAKKQKEETALNQLSSLQERLFPNGGLQERSMNFFELFMNYGPQILEVFKQEIRCFDAGVTCLEI